MNATVIELQNVEKSFGPKRVLAGVNLAVEGGETYTILGGSGSGKSVTIKLMIGLLRADSGHVLVEGRDVTALGEREGIALRGRFGMVFQGAALFDSLSVLENVAYPLREHASLSEEDVRKRVAEKLALVGLEGIESKLPAELSGGMRKRVAVARAVVMDPKIILYDEPTSGLDPVIAATVDELVNHTRDTLGVTQVVVTHDMESAYRIADRIAMLYQGKIIALGTPEEIRSNSNPLVQQFITGSSKGPMTKGSTDQT